MASVWRKKTVLVKWPADTIWQSFKVETNSYSTICNFGKYIFSSISTKTFAIKIDKFAIKIDKFAISTNTFFNLKIYVLVLSISTKTFWSNDVQTPFGRVSQKRPIYLQSIERPFGNKEFGNKDFVECFLWPPDELTSVLICFYLLLSAFWSWS